jgi:hypothetical protein
LKISDMQHMIAMFNKTKTWKYDQGTGKHVNESNKSSRNKTLKRKLNS